VQVHLKATVGGVGDLSGVTFVGDPLLVSPDGATSLVTGPTPEIPTEAMTLAPGQELTFDYELKIERAGPFTLLSTAQAVDAAGRAIGPVEASRSGRGGALRMTATADPAEFDLDEAEDGSGPEPQDTEVTVTITNPLPVAVEGAELSILEPSSTSPPLLPSTIGRSRT
jgi:hypothetical protein